jgi:hypothetical protein
MATHSTPPSGAGTGRATLADRYVHAATRGLSGDQREDVAHELRASIADRVESLHVEHRGISAAQAELTALVELGEPDRLAASYSGRPRQLIGPEVYPAYVRALRAILVTAVPLAAVVFAAIDGFEGAPIGAAIGGGAWMAFMVATQVAFWVTIAFALVERRRGADDVRQTLTEQWTPDQLPELPQQRRGSVTEVATNIAWLGVLVTVIVLQHPRSPIYQGGERLPLLDPALWSFWLPLILVLIAVEMSLEVLKFALKTWTPRRATISLAVGALFAAPGVYLAATSQLFNPPAVIELQRIWPGFDAGTASSVVIVIALALWVQDGVDSWRKTGRHQAQLTIVATTPR